MHSTIPAGLVLTLAQAVGNIATHTCHLSCPCSKQVDPGAKIWQQQAWGSVEVGLLKVSMCMQGLTESFLTGSQAVAAPV